ncbi:MAG: PEP-CTERM sorting domain-containing protein [Planctomycetota bacterium]
MFKSNAYRSFPTAVLAGACFAGGLTFAGQATAGAGGDLMFYVSDGELKVGRYDFDGGSGLVLEVESEPLVISEALPDWEDGGKPGTDEPGLTTDGALAPDPIEGGGDPNGIDPDLQFPPNTALVATANVLPVIGLDVAYWDATGPVTFGASPHNVLVESPFFSVPLNFDEELEFDSDGVAPAGQLAPWQSDANGTNHDHFEFIIDALDADATPGIYAFSLTFEADGAFSEPQYFLLGYSDEAYFTDPEFGIEDPSQVTLTDLALEAALDQADEYFEENIIPEPASGLLLAAAGGLALIRRR